MDGALAAAQERPDAAKQATARCSLLARAAPIPYQPSLPTADVVHAVRIRR
jgi:hypothetical protein